ncbi:MAG: hypothetical protein ACRDKS_07780 [Actinomycetota bacterium]
MRRYVLMHQHRTHECKAAFAAWLGFDSPLRRRPALASCVEGGRVWWTVEAPDEASAYAQLPPFVAERTELLELRAVEIP